MILTVNILRKTQFEANVDRYVTNVFQFNKTMLVDYDVRYRYEGRQSAVEVRLVGEPLSHNVIENASAQMAYYGLENTELIVRQADENERIDFSKIQHSYAEIIDEKNRTIARLEERLASVQPAGYRCRRRYFARNGARRRPCGTGIDVRNTYSTTYRCPDRHRSRGDRPAGQPLAGSSGVRPDRGMAAHEAENR